MGVALAAIAAAAAPAHGATYTEDACGRAGGAGAAAAGFAALGAPGATADACGAGGGLALTVDGATGAGSAAGWRFVPPPGTTVAGLTLHRRVAIPARSAAVYTLDGSAERCDASSRCGDGLFDLPVPTDGLDFRLACPSAGCGPGGATVVLRRLQIVLRDDDAPTVTAAPPGAPVRGRAAIRAEARDSGGGVAGLAVLVDGDQRAARSFCRPPFARAIPCPRRVRTTFALDTRGLVGGLHRVDVVATDATGVNRAVSGPRDLEVAAGPRPPRRPRVVLRAGRPRLRNGETLVLVAHVPLAARDRDVAFEVRVGGRWRAFALRRPGADGRARVTHRLRRTYRRLRYAFRAVVRGAGPRGPRRSPVVRVLVNECMGRKFCVH